MRAKGGTAAFWHVHGLPVNASIDHHTTERAYSQESRRG